MGARHLSKVAAEVCREQGWDNETIIIHLMGCINEICSAPDMTLGDYLKEVAKEENQQK